MNWFRKQEEPIDPAIEAFVDMTLANRSLNMGCVPDSIEKKFYIKITKYAIDANRNVLSTVEIRFLRHKLTFDVQPIQDDFV